MDLATQPQLYRAKQMDASQKKALALEAIRNNTPITELAQDNKVSRKFIYKQQDKAIDAINDKFTPHKVNDDKVLFYIPVTREWICKLILCLLFYCRANHRGIQKLLLDMCDYDISLGTIHNVVNDAKVKAKEINAHQDLTNIKLATLDEKFHYNKPVLTGVDIRSLYCYLLSQAQHRDFDTWGNQLLDLKQQGLNPDRFFGDDADGIRSAQKYVYPGVAYDIDNFHIIRDMMEMRRFFRNRLKSTITNVKTIEGKLAKAVLDEKIDDCKQQLEVAKAEEIDMKTLSQSIDILVNWMQHDVLNMPGVEPASRYELFDFVLDELNKLAIQHPHRIKSICTTLKNQKYFLLAFTEVLNEKFLSIADEFVFPLEKIWEMCELQRCKHSSDNYAVRSLPLQDYFQADFDDVEDAVLKALDSTERTSSMVENLHSRLSPYFFLRREIGFGYLDLLRFYLNHTPFQRSAREERKGRTPAEILSGQPHPHWLEMLGYQRFKRAA